MKKFCVIIIVLIFCSFVYSKNLRCYVSSDAMISEGQPTTVFADGDVLSAGKVSDETKCLLRFDFSGLPVDSVVVSAELNIYIETAGAVININKVLSQWSESTLTWQGFNNGGIEGIDFEQKSAFQGSLPSYTGYYQLMLDSDLAEEWVDLPDKNYGVVISVLNAGQSVDIKSREWLNGLNAAYMDIEYLELSVPNDCSDVVQMGFNPQVDFNNDCYVNIEDFKEFAVKWLTCIDPANVNCVNVWE